ncbi:hypothetical protein RCL1_001881 [Eukaryota sp. TZLM3-RCL]
MNCSIHVPVLYASLPNCSLRLLQKLFLVSRKFVNTVLSFCESLSRFSLDQSYANLLNNSSSLPRLFYSFSSLNLLSLNFPVDAILLSKLCFTFPSFTKFNCILKGPIDEQLLTRVTIFFYPSNNVLIDFSKCVHNSAIICIDSNKDNLTSINSFIGLYPKTLNSLFLDLNLKSNHSDCNQLILRLFYSIHSYHSILKLGISSQLIGYLLNSFGNFVFENLRSLFISGITFENDLIKLSQGKFKYALEGFYCEEISFNNNKDFVFNSDDVSFKLSIHRSKISIIFNRFPDEACEFVSFSNQISILIDCLSLITLIELSNYNSDPNYESKPLSLCSFYHFSLPNFPHLEILDLFFFSVFTLTIYEINVTVEMLDNIFTHFTTLKRLEISKSTVDVVSRHHLQDSAINSFKCRRKGRICLSDCQCFHQKLQSIKGLLLTFDTPIPRNSELFQDPLFYLSHIGSVVFSLVSENFVANIQFNFLSEIQCLSFWYSLSNFLSKFDINFQIEPLFQSCKNYSSLCSCCRAYFYLFYDFFACNDDVSIYESFVNSLVSLI